MLFSQKSRKKLVPFRLTIPLQDATTVDDRIRTDLGIREHQTATGAFWLHNVGFSIGIVSIGVIWCFSRLVPFAIDTFI